MPDPIFAAACAVVLHPLHFGYEQYTCYHNTCGPIGFVVGIPHGDKYFEVVRLYVDERFRRKGVARLIHSPILSAYEAVVSNGASDDGRAFMEAFGYQPDPIFGWIYRKLESK